jgi:hypothetical protein
MHPHRKSGGIPLVFAGATFLAFVGTANAHPKGPMRPALSRPLTSFDAAAVELAKHRAAQRLRAPECVKLLTDFRDSEGRTLDRRLESWAMSAADYVQMIPFVDGSVRPICGRSSVALVSTPGMALVCVCPAGAGVLNSRGAKVQIENPSLSEFMVIHEMLHTLGLGENPPSSFEITEQVMRRCR